MTRYDTIFQTRLATVICRSFFVFVLALSLAGASVMRAQTSGTGSIEGTVTDATGALVSGATVTATNTLTGTDTVSTTTGTGRFVLPLLQPGPYSVTVKAPGFKTVKQEHVTVDALANVTLDPKLTVGETTVSVEVTDQPTMLMTQDVKLGSSIDNETYDSLPLAQNQSARGIHQPSSDWQSE